LVNLKKPPLFIFYKQRKQSTRRQSQEQNPEFYLKQITSLVFIVKKNFVYKVELKNNNNNSPYFPWFFTQSNIIWKKIDHVTNNIK
jgi:hypothetical protein